MSEIEHANHDRFGKFATGNKLGVGNVLNKRYATHRKEWMEASTPEERLKVRAKHVELALNGDMAAIKHYNEMTYGKSEQTINLGTGDDTLKLDMQGLTAVILTALVDHPDARIKVAAALRQNRLAQLEGGGNGPSD